MAKISSLAAEAAPRCTACGSERVVKNGKNASSHQQFCCRVCRGGSWMSPDLFMRYKAREADIDGRFHKEMGFTMVRFWKGQVPFRQAFDACDRYGILVWWEWMGLGGESWTKHDMWGYGGLDNPESTAGVRDMLKRLRNHPSVALYVGNNERPGPPEGDRLFTQQKDELNPGTCFLDDSLTPPLHHGDGPWQALDPAAYWNKAQTIGFYSEIGLPHILSVENMRAMMPESDLWPINNRMWSFHQIDAPNTGEKNYLQKINAEYGSSSSIEQFCFKASAFDYNYNRAILEAAGNSMWKGCTGVFLWMSKSAWPNLNWSTYDYYHGVDGTYFGVKKACEPIHIQWDVRNWQMSVVNAIGATRPGLTAVAAVYNADGALQSTKSCTVDALANQRTSALTLDKPPALPDVHFVRLLLKDRSGTISDNFYWDSNTYGNYTGLDSLEKVSLDLTGSVHPSGEETVVSATLTNKARTVAFMARLGLFRAKSAERVLPTFYDDNYLSLLPGESRTVTMRCKTSDLAGMSPQLHLDGYNVAAKLLELSSR